MSHVYLDLLTLFVVLSLSAFGGGKAILPALHAGAVQQHHWLTDREFVDAFSIGQAAPGPSTLMVLLIGYKAAGVAGAALAGAAMFLPSSCLVYGLARAWERWHRSPWVGAIERGLAPVTVGLILSSGYLLGNSAIKSLPLGAVTAGTVVLLLLTRLHPLWAIAAGGAVGWLIG